MEHEMFMARCLELARQGSAAVAPNPMVGAVLVHRNRIIGEGFHRRYGGPHAEVECIQSVPPDKKGLIPESTLYVSLEPCNHFGKTPPCTDVIIESNIPKVVIGCLDRSEKVDGKGRNRLMDAGIEVITGVLQQEASFLNRRFFTFQEKKRPYVILKWAKTAGGIIGLAGERLKISNEITDRKVHQWRSEESAILIGTNTALLDDPYLTTRLWPGKNPVRVIIDKDLWLPKTLHVFNDEAPTWVFNKKQEGEEKNITYIRCTDEGNLVSFILSELHKRNILSILVEGGGKTLSSFLTSGLWDEARIIENTQMDMSEGVAAPATDSWMPYHSETFRTDAIYYYLNENNQPLSHGN
jgi:diaminohydroxyphosphoribosylaminopyrimidine deaminase/5-amino-6-(5-phosphoribosylamino)uracil reductase